MNRGTPDNYGFLSPGTPSTPGAPGSPGGPGGGLPSGFPGGHHTTVQIIHDDGSWSTGIRNLFIYGTGGARIIMTLRRGPLAPAQATFILGTSLLADAVSRIATNAINDPTYIRAHISNIRAI